MHGTRAEEEVEVYATNQQKQLHEHQSTEKFVKTCSADR
jgi:hypothetical protein